MTFFFSKHGNNGGEERFKPNKESSLDVVHTFAGRTLTAASAGGTTVPAAATAATAARAASLRMEARALHLTGPWI